MVEGRLTAPMCDKPVGDVADRDEGVGVEEDGSQAVVECGDLHGE